MARSSDAELMDLKETTMQRDKFFEQTNAWKCLAWNLPFHFCHFLILVMLCVHVGFIIYGLTMNLLGYPNIGLNIMQPLVLLFFCLLHSILVLGFLKSVVFLITTVVISISFELFHSFDTPLQRVYVNYVPYEEPFSYFMFLYLFLMIPFMMYRHRKGIGLWNSIRICLLTGFLMLGHTLVNEPVGFNAGLWKYPKDTQWFYEGIPVWVFVSNWIQATLTVFIFLLFDGFVDLIRSKHDVLIKLTWYCSTGIHDENTTVQRPFRWILHLELIIAFLFQHGIDFLIIHPYRLRIVSVIIYLVPIILAFLSINEWGGKPIKEEKYISIE